MITDFDFKLFEDYSIGDVDSKDYPDFCDAFLEMGVYDGREMTEEECEWFTENYPEFINEQAYQSLIS